LPRSSVLVALPPVPWHRQDPVLRVRVRDHGGGDLCSELVEKGLTSYSPRMRTPCMPLPGIPARHLATPRSFFMSLQTATDALTNGARNLTDDVLQSAQNAVQTTRNAADHSLDQAQERLHALRNRASPAVDDLAARAQALAARSIDYCADTSARARRQIQQTADATGRYVAEQPGKSLVIAAASGAALAALALWWSRRRRSY
jgi:ElaB/YqjD/DUF883 family membrane-anchored ribosome-binding protein